MKTQQKIKILQKVKAQLLQNKENNSFTTIGLCFLLGSEGVSYKNIKLFNLENAIKYAHAIDYISGFWWNVCTHSGEVYDYENRILFLDWLIAQYSKPWLYRILHKY